MSKKFFFAKMFFSQITFEIRKLVREFGQHRVLLVETHRNKYTLTLKGRYPNLTSGQGHVRSRVGTSRSHCISVDASVQEKTYWDHPQHSMSILSEVRGKKRM